MESVPLISVLANVGTNSRCELRISPHAANMTFYNPKVNMDDILDEALDNLDIGSDCSSTDSAGARDTDNIKHNGSDGEDLCMGTESSADDTNFNDKIQGNISASASSAENIASESVRGWSNTKAGAVTGQESESKSAALSPKEGDDHAGKTKESFVKDEKAGATKEKSTLHNRPGKSKTRKKNSTSNPSTPFEALMSQMLQIDNKIHNGADPDAAAANKMMRNVMQQLHSELREEGGDTNFDQVAEEMATKIMMSDPSAKRTPMGQEGDSSKSKSRKNNAENIDKDEFGRMMEELSDMAESGDCDDMVNGMMTQLLRKDVMYEPMKQIMIQFPRWMAEHRSELSHEEYERYGRQYQCFQRIVDVYDNDAENFPRLMEIMQQVQEYGHPPQEIIENLMPGVNFHDIGSISNFPSGLGKGDCAIM